MFRILLISLVFTSTASWAQNGTPSETSKCAEALQYEITSLEEVYSQFSKDYLNVQLTNVIGAITDLEVRKKAIGQVVNILMNGGVATLIDRTGYIYHLEDVASVKNNPVQILQNEIKMVDGWPVRTLKFKKVPFDPAVHTQNNHAYRPFSRVK